MRIILATPIYPPEVGGPATYVVEIAHRLSIAHQVTIVAYAEAAQIHPNVAFVAVSKKQPLPVRLVAYFFALLREAKQADVIYVQNAVAAGLPAALVGMLLHKPVVLKFVGDEAWERASQSHKTIKQLEDFLKSPEGGVRTKIMMAVQGFVLRHVSIITTPSAYLGDVLRRTYHLDPKKTQVNYNAADEADTMLPPQRIPYQISVACRLVSWKHIDGIIRAAVALHKKFSDTRVVIAGDGPEKERLQNLIRTLQAEKYITLLGRISQKDSRVLQQSSMVHVINSSYEGLSHEALNAFAMGTPVVATNIHGNDEVVYHEKTGLLVPVGDDTALAQAVEKIFTDSSLRERLAKGGAEILRKKFSWDAHMQMLLRMFQSVIRVGSRHMIIDGKKIAEDILMTLAQERDTLPSALRLGVVMSAGDAATESFIRIKARAAQRLNVEVVREELPSDAKTNDALAALERLTATTQGVIVQLPLPKGVDVDVVLARVVPSHDVDAIGLEPRLVLAPVAGAVKEVLERAHVDVQNKKAVVVGAGKLVGKPSAELLRQLGADVSVVTTEQGSLDELAHADIVVLGAGNPGFIKPTMLKQGVVVIDAGTSEAGGKLVGDADPACAEVASVFTPVPGGMGPIAVAMIFKNLFTLVKNH